MTKRLYVVTRNDLAPGLQAAQAAHAAMLWQHENPTKQHVFATLIILSVPCVHELRMLGERMEQEGFAISPWYEPDLDFELTAWAVRLSKKHHELLAHLPLALR